jgi:hypothetical protein
MVQGESITQSEVKPLMLIMGIVIGLLLWPAIGLVLFVAAMRSEAQSELNRTKKIKDDIKWLKQCLEADPPER